MTSLRLQAYRFKAASNHGLCSLLVLSVVLFWVFWVWFPGSFDAMLKVDSFFWVVVLVDLCLGPLIIFVIYDVSKPRRELLVDYFIVTFIQLIVLLYGLYTLSQSRPVFVVFVKDRLEIVVARDLDNERLMLADQSYKKLPMWGAEQVCSESPNSPEEVSELIESGYDVQYQPKYYRPCNQRELVDNGYSLSRLVAIISEKRRVFSSTSLDQVELRIEELATRKELVWLPVVSHYGFWVGVISSDSGQVIEYFDVDPF